MVRIHPCPPYQKMVVNSLYFKYRLFLIKLFKKEKYINENYDSMQEYPWAEYPNYTTFENGILPTYHMNKEHWITILLDGTVSKEKYAS
jgi:predicted DNA-binding protein (MmcQ/YjbR family)